MRRGHCIIAAIRDEQERYKQMQIASYGPDAIVKYPDYEGGIKWRYQEYKILCLRSNEKPLSLFQWLLQDVEPINAN